MTQGGQLVNIRIIGFPDEIEKHLPALREAVGEHQIGGPMRVACHQEAESASGVTNAPRCNKGRPEPPLRSRSLADQDGHEHVDDDEQGVHSSPPLRSGPVTDRRGFCVVWPNAAVYLAAGALVLGFVAWLLIKMFRGR